MAALGVERRLAAILAADIVGYTRLVEQDEAETLAAIKRLRREVVDPLLTKHHGRIVKLMGDGAIAEFASVVDAVGCAVAVQREATALQADVSPDRRIVFRIGVNLGDVVVEDEDLLGDGVNVAARLEQLCDPGGVLVSGTAFDHLRGKLDLTLDYAGEQHVKNIAQPVRIYRVRLDGRGLPWRLRVRPYLRPMRWAAAFLVLLLAAGAGWWWLKSDALVTTKPVVAVLPFDNLGGDESTGRLADGITEDIITDLARFRDLEVIARNSTLVYKDKAVDVREVGRDLRAGYVLDGSVQRQVDQIRITAWLVDADTGTNLWSARWDRPAEETFAVQSEIAEEVAGALGSVNGLESVNAAELRKLKGRPPASLTAYDNYLLAVEAKGQFTEDAIFSGIDHATRAIVLDPAFARAYAVRARLHYNTVHYGVGYETAMRAMEADARRAVELDPNDPDARAALAWFLLNSGRLEESEIEIRAALKVNPANVNVLIFAAAVLAWNGKSQEAAQLADKVLRIDPRASSGSLNTIKDAYFFARRFEDTVAVISRIPEDARSRGSRLFLTFSHAFLDRQEETERARAELLANYPTMSAELLLNTGWVFGRPEDERLFLEGFQAAQLPLCAVDADLDKLANPRHLPECVKP